MTEPSPLSKFQDLLKDLFQFDCADLDFGIYRIMNHKRQVIEKWIAEDLPRAISDELQCGALHEQNQAKQALDTARQNVLENLGADALDVDGNLVKYRESPIGKKYLEAQAKAAGSRSAEALEAQIYNHLYTFFSRYWQDGDFISRRRYSKKERYAIPYNGEEVTLYWANHDQYYVKSGEYFTDYSYKAPNGVTVHFKLQQADVEQNNVKGEKRFFLPVLDDIAWDANSPLPAGEGPGVRGTLTIPFEFRPLTAQENIAYGQKNQQETIIANAVTEIPKRVKAPDALAALAAERRRTEKGETVTWLEHHLRQYTRRNTSDFFIHKDLRGFLSRELDFYLKNEVLNLDEMEAAGEQVAEGWFQLMRLIKRVGNRIIDFLAQIEDFQKMLWEKKKFVTETFYVITVGHIKERFHADIAACDAQWQEWECLLALSALPKDLLSEDLTTQEGRLAFLKDHPTLPLDTRHFSPDFTDRLLADFDNLDDLTDGLLVHSENWQALNLLQEKYRERVKQVHIDPPYNTDTSGFVYKNDYRHSSWLSMMTERVRGAKEMLHPSGLFTCHIDENEFERLRLLFEHMFGYVGTAVWDKLNPMMGAKELAIQHEYILFCTSKPHLFIVRPQNVKAILSRAREIIRKHGGLTEQTRREFNDWVENADGFSGGEKAYKYLNDDGRVYRLVAMTWPNPSPPPPEFFTPLIHPVTGKPCPVPNRGWSQSPKRMSELLANSEIVFGPDETTQPQRKVFLSEDKSLSSVIRNGSRGRTEIESLGLDFTYNHPSSLYTTLLDAGLDETGLVLDFFAGSGTTGHAVINLNRQDGGRRKFILVEMAQYFDTVLLPRIKKVTFSPEWKDGKPRRMATAEEAGRGPRIVKVIRLESYEDALNNLTFDKESGQAALDLCKDDYLLHYMLRWETRHSATLLDVEELQSPFACKLQIHRDGETRERVVDLPETFNYLLGLDVQTRKVYDDEGRRYLVYRGVLRNGRTVAVIWRETQGWTTEDFERDRDFVAEQKLTDGADDVFVNGDSLIPDARSLDPIFKERMFAGVEV
jgi:adenine-specific DNA-methyltransferase